jgi:hypothetical protein
MGTAFINDFILCANKLQDKGEGFTPTTKLSKFLDKIVDMVVQQLRNDSTKTFEDYVLCICTQEQELD